MNSRRLLATSGKLLAAAAVTVLAATCVASGVTASASRDHTGSSVNQATKEWKSAPPSKADVVVATKEWKSEPQTKEW